MNNQALTDRMREFCTSGRLLGFGITAGIDFRSVSSPHLVLVPTFVPKQRPPLLIRRASVSVRYLIGARPERNLNDSTLLSDRANHYPNMSCG
jgi:hypothetical protein